MSQILAPWALVIFRPRESSPDTATATLLQISTDVAQDGVPRIECALSDGHIGTFVCPVEQIVEIVDLRDPESLNRYLEA